MEISYDYICTHSDNIPQQAIEYLDSQIVQNTGGAIELLFPQFCNVFKLATGELVRSWSTPKLVLNHHLNQWLSFLVIQNNDKNLFFRLRPKFMEKEGEDFERDHQMLPNSWKELYRWFNSFVITEQSYSPRDWWNTPFRYEARLDLDDYEDGSGATRKQTEQFATKIGCKRESLRCWLLTENEDALFIDEEHCDQKVYHVHGKQLDDIYVLPDPQQTLDEYLAHFLSGGKPADFDFRKE